MSGTPPAPCAGRGRGHRLQRGARRPEPAELPLLTGPPRGHGARRETGVRGPRAGATAAGSGGRTNSMNSGPLRGPGPGGAPSARHLLSRALASPRQGPCDVPLPAAQSHRCCGGGHGTPGLARAGRVTPPLPHRCFCPCPLPCSTAPAPLSAPHPSPPVALAAPQDTRDGPSRPRSALHPLPPLPSRRCSRSALPWPPCLPGPCTPDGPPGWLPVPAHSTPGESSCPVPQGPRATAASLSERVP